MSEVKVDTISERTTDGGVTVEGVKIEDGVATFQTAAGSPLVFEGATADAYETTFAITDPTADRTITFPDASLTLGASGNNTPTFSAYLSSNQTIADATWVKVEFDTITVTDGGTYDNSTDHKWTPGEAGDYVLKANLGLYHVGGNNTDIAASGIAFYLNGAVMSPVMDFPNYYGYTQNTLPGWVHLQADAVVTLGATDYIQVYGYIDHRWTAYTNYVKGDRASYFASYKLIGS